MLESGTTWPGVSGASGPLDFDCASDGLVAWLGELVMQVECVEDELKDGGKLSGIGTAEEREAIATSLGMAVDKLLFARDVATPVIAPAFLAAAGD